MMITITTTGTKIIQPNYTLCSNCWVHHSMILFVFIIIYLQTESWTPNLIIKVVSSYSLLEVVKYPSRIPYRNFKSNQNNRYDSKFRIKQRTTSSSCCTVVLCSNLNDESINSVTTIDHNSCCLERIVQQEFSQRLVNIPINSCTNQVVNPNMIAEVYVNKQCILVQIISMIASKSVHKIQQEPKFQVNLISSLIPSNNNDQNNTGTIEFPSSMIIDIGQIITIWDDNNNNNKINNDVSFHNLNHQMNHNAAADIERILDRLHRTRCTQPVKTSTTTTTWSKQHINQLIEKEFGNNNNNNNNNEKVYAETVLRKIQKAGMNYHRIIDSTIVMEHLFVNNNKNKKIDVLDNNNNHPTIVQQRAISAYIISNDGKYGGRFKRWPCVYISSSSSSIDNITNISIINGGWFVTDTNVRIGLEAQKFANKANNMISNTDIPSQRTIADERIHRRLECLAMGELMSSLRRDNDQQQQQQQADDTLNTSKNLEIDVREVLRTMNLPITPDGAKQALIRTGYWSNDISKQQRVAQMIQPWSQSILDAAKWYSHIVSSFEHENDPTRIDLTHLPCVSVDAAKTTFRDDALGVRPREMMGRTIIPGASKWEILIHITDVSDIYTIPKNDGSDSNVNEMSMIVKSQNYLSILRNAAARRGTSRYDLPLGPLHLLPPIVLHTLSFPTATDMYNKKNRAITRCVTVWAYIDERNGQLLDCGIERTIISSPMKLSFKKATDLLDGNAGELDQSDSVMNPINQAQAILMVVERNLKLWEMYDRQKNIVAQKREVRLMKREQTTEQKHTLQEQSILPKYDTNQKALRDDGVDGFRRTRGHRLIDTSLNLYSMIAIQLLEQANAPIPYVIGAHYKDRGGRFGTAPLRRYMDGQIQRQILAILFKYGQAMTKSDCKDVSNIANNANNAIDNIRSLRKGKNKR
jgi:hypothetical protein